MKDKNTLTHWIIFTFAVLISFGVMQRSIAITNVELNKIAFSIQTIEAVTGEKINKNQILEKKTDENIGLNNTQSNNTKPSMSETQTTMRAILKTSAGDIEVIFRDETPVTVENFTKLAKEGFYDGTRFHRVIKDFMIQGGDPQSKDLALAARWGTGGPGYNFKDEIIASDKNMPLGALAMANAGPGTNGSQFFIVTNPQGEARLLPKHTLFGMVTKGLDVVLAINSTQTGLNDRPVKDVVIEKIILQ